MSDPTLELQGALVTTLKAAAGVSAIVGTRVYDTVPTTPTFPYLTIGDDQIIPDLADEYDGADVILTVHGWTRLESPGYPQLKRAGKAINAALTDAALSIVGFRLVNITPEQTQYLRDPDGITRHGVFVFRARTEPSA